MGEESARTDESSYIKYLEDTIKEQDNVISGLRSEIEKQQLINKLLHADPIGGERRFPPSDLDPTDMIPVNKRGELPSERRRRLENESRERAMRKKTEKEEG